MADFAEAVMLVLEQEGGLVNDPSDPGGITNFGISFNFYKTIKPKASSEDIKNLSVDMAKEIYKHSFWDANKYGLILDQAIANKIFSLSVVMGATAANRCLQRALHSVCDDLIDIDGVVGPKTIYIVNKCPSAPLLAALKSEAAGQFRITILLNHSLEKYAHGWINRAYI